LSKIIDEFKPDIVFSPIPSDKHPDHSGIGVIMSELFPRSYFYIIWGNEILSEYEEVKIDISRYKVRKREAVLEYKSQIRGFNIEKFLGDFETFYLKKLLS
ncbi:MAG: hypothetical protein JZD40_05190, partial [Sulfolobus sp.]|nr:hypothetical protein [Sulfolobus sp.]